MYYLPTTKDFGKLEIIKTYHSYDIPRTFLVNSSKKKTIFLVLWTEEELTCDSWYYAPVNDTEIERLESGRIQLHDIFLNKVLYRLVTPFNLNSPAKITRLSESIVDKTLLPPKGFSVTALANGKYEVSKKKVESFTQANNVHELRIYRDRSKKPVSWSSVSAIFGAWEDIYNSIIDSLKLDNPEFLPEMAKKGSYKMQFRVNHNEKILTSFKEISSQIFKKNFSLESLLLLPIDLAELENLILMLKTHNFKLDILTHTGHKLVTLDTKKLVSVESELLQYNQSVISSDLVPQANELNRIFLLVESLATKKIFNSETEKITPRQVDYYITATRLLGFIKPSDLSLSPAGWKLSALTVEKDKYRLLAEYFELSACGWAWLNYCKVNTIKDLDPNTATDFLLNNSKGLRETTVKRRATTLKKWALTFQQYLE